MNHNWYATITAQVLMATDISSTQKLLIALISNLSNERKYCYASNNYLAEKLGLNPGTVSQAISDLETKGYLGRIIIFKPDSKEIEHRFLTVIEKVSELPPSTENDIYPPLKSYIPPLEKLHTPPLEKLQDNNKVFKNKDEKESLTFFKSNEELIKDKKDDFYTLIKNFSALNIGRYPAALYDDFFKYWSEPHKNGKKIRYDDEKFFDIGKRLGTFAKFAGPEKLSKMWEDQKKEERQQVKQAELL